jgi:hypothetical protein
LENAAQSRPLPQRGSVPRLLSFVLHDESSQAAIAAFREKAKEDQGEKSATIILAGCLKKSEKIKKIVK